MVQRNGFERLMFGNNTLSSIKIIPCGYIQETVSWNRSSVNSLFATVERYDNGGKNNFQEVFISIPSFHAAIAETLNALTAVVVTCVQILETSARF